MNDIAAHEAAYLQKCIVCRANEAGRGFLANDESNRLGVWPAFLERLKADPDLLFFFLRCKPDLRFSPSGRLGV